MNIFRRLFGGGKKAEAQKKEVSKTQEKEFVTHGNAGETKPENRTQAIAEFEKDEAERLKQSKFHSEAERRRKESNEAVKKHQSKPTTPPTPKPSGNNRPVCETENPPKVKKALSDVIHAKKHRLNEKYNNPKTVERDPKTGRYKSRKK